MFGKLKSLANSGISSALNALQNNEEFVSSIIDKVVSINFLETLDFVEKNENMIPQSEIVRSTILTLNDASNEYFLSDESNKNKVFINSIIDNIDAQKAIDAFEPIVKFIPFGSVILFILKAIVKFKKFGNG
jgi:mannitol-1-phosphate/altronate dehydrogenase